MIDKSQYTLTEVSGGYRIEYHNETYYIGCSTENGYCYKDKEAFDSGKGICYINEYGFLDEVEWDENVPDEIPEICDQENISMWGTGMNDDNVQCGYTRQDILTAVRDRLLSDTDILDDANNDQAQVERFITYMANWAFEICDWQGIDSYLYEIDLYEQWDNFLEIENQNN